jgi:FkbH-like protein
MTTQEELSMAGEFDCALDAAKCAISRQEDKEAFRILKEISDPNSDFVSQSRITKVFASLDCGLLDLKPIRIALLASTTVDHFADLLRFWLALEGFAASIWIAPYDTVAATVLDEGSKLYTLRPDITWLFLTYRDVRIRSNPNNAVSIGKSIDDLVFEYKKLWNKIQSNLHCVVIHNNADVPAEDAFGNFARQVAWTRRNVLHRYNLALGDAAHAGVVIFDIDHIASTLGRSRWTDWRYWYHSKHPCSLEAHGALAFRSARLISSIRGQAKKCLVVDLDNTLWGGVIGDDGLSGIGLGNDAAGEPFLDFQRYLLALKERGIILAVCSKNDESIAKEPFQAHPDMRLRLSDIAVFQANWENKVDNIREISRMLNVGLNAMVFVDDNPAERGLVRQLLPMVAVPDLPEDPSRYVQAIDSHCYFETIAFSTEDRDRANYYGGNAARTELLASFSEMNDYLKSLEMVSAQGNTDPFNLPRMAQLINKSNQFHLTGTRFSESELRDRSAQPNFAVRYFKLADKFGDNGLISVVVLDASNKQLIVETWVMSCRVLGRTMEEFICNDMIEIARRRGCTSILGRYVPSGKNKLVAQLYERLGFSLVAADQGTTTWQLTLKRGLDKLNTFVAPTDQFEQASLKHV